MSEREKAKGRSGKIDAARKAFANLETFCKSETAKDMESFPKAGASCQLFLSLQVSTSEIIRMQKERTF